MEQLGADGPRTLLTTDDIADALVTHPGDLVILRNDPSWGVGLTLSVEETTLYASVMWSRAPGKEPKILRHVAFDLIKLLKPGTVAMVGTGPQVPHRY